MLGRWTVSFKVPFQSCSHSILWGVSENLSIRNWLESERLRNSFLLIKPEGALVTRNLALRWCCVLECCSSTCKICLQFVFSFEAVHMKIRHEIFWNDIKWQTGTQTQSDRPDIPVYKRQRGSRIRRRGRSLLSERSARDERVRGRQAPLFPWLAPLTCWHWASHNATASLAWMGRVETMTEAKGVAGVERGAREDGG